MDSKSKVDGVKSVDSTPRSYPMVSHATFIGGAPDDKNEDALMRLREGTGGYFVNMILSHNAFYGIKNNDCGKEARSQTAPDNKTPVVGDSLYVSSQNIIFDSHKLADASQIQFKLDSSCTWTP